MKIATITLNPAIDQTVRVNSFRVNAVNRGQSMQFQAGGKGVNVASFLVDAGYTVAATGFLGQENVAVFEHFFALQHIEDCFIRVPGQTRIGVKIVDEINGQTTDINMPGQAPSEAAIDALFTTVEQLSASCDWFVLAGALPPGVPTTIYATLITKLKMHGKRVVLDTSQQALHEGILAGPTIAKPNIDELQQLVGRTLADESTIEQAARQLLNNGCELVVISMGEKGAMFISQEKTFIAVPPAISIKSTVGAGDAMVAGLVAGFIQGLSLPDCARLATAFSLGAITRTSFRLPTPEIVQAYSQQVSIHTSTNISS